MVAAAEAAFWVAVAAAAAVEVAAVEAAVDLTAHLGDRLTVNWQWVLIGL